MFLINEVSKQVNLSQKRIREYEKEGFIRPEREANTNNRLYSDFEVAQIRRISFLIHERGFTLAALKQLVQLAHCWQIFGCEGKESCPAYLNPLEPCYKVKRAHGVNSTARCDKCAIYLNRNGRKSRILVKPDE